jgi:hypothetical protein
MRPIGRMLRRSAVLATVLALVVSATALAVTWGPAVAVDASGHAYSAFPKTIMVTGTQRVHVFYGEDNGTTRTVWYRSSADGGSTFGTPVQVSHVSAYGAVAGSIARDGTNLDLVWSEFNSDGNYRIWYRRSINSGTDWSTPVALTSALGYAISPDVTRSGDRVTVAYTDGNTDKIYVRISTNGGVSFGTKQSVATTTNQPYGGDLFFEGFVAVGDSSGTITVAWNSNNATIRTRRSTDGGVTWSTSVTLATNSYGHPITLTTNASKVIIGYKSVTSVGSRATQRHSGDEGVHWTAAAYVGAGPSGTPMFAYGGGVLRTVYSRCTVSDCSSEAVFFRTSSDFATTWSAESRASRTVDTPKAFAGGVGVIANGQSVVIYTRFDGGSSYKLYARKTV